jgi:hypothetical protein
MATLKLKANQSHRTANVPLSFLSRGLWICASVLGLVVAFFLLQFAVLPLATRSYAASISPIAPQAEPGATTADFLKELNAQNLAANSLGSVTHPYLTGHGTLLGFAGDNIQIFEYPNSDIARTEALALFGRSPRLASESYFHLYLRDNLIGLYFGHNMAVMSVTQQMLGSPLASPVSTSSKAKFMTGTYF